jgi:hypothetical protein
MKIQFGKLLAAAACLLLAGVQASKADTYNFTQANCNTGLGCNGTSAVIATATVVNDADGVLITFHLVDSNFAFFMAGNPPWAGLNVSGFPTLDSATGGPAGAIWTLNGAFHDGSTGDFGQSAGFQMALHNIQFTGDVVLDIDGISTSNFSANAAGFAMAIDLCNNNGGSGCAGGTGFDGSTLSGTQTPLPATLALLGPALGFGYLGLRRRRRKPAVAVA